MALLASTDSTTYDDFDVLAATEYLYAIVAVNAFGKSEVSDVVTGYKQIQAPTGVAVSYGTFSDRVVISWNAAESVSSYIIYRSSTGSFLDAIQIGTIDGITSFSDATAAAGTNYTYWVASIDSDGNPIFDEAQGATGLAGDTAPDSMIGKTGTSVKGNDIYNTTGTGQRQKVSTRRYRTAKASIVTQNDGSIDDVLTYLSSGNSRNFDVTFTRVSPEPTNLTASMKTGIASSTDLAPGATEQIAVKVSLKRSRKKNSSRSFRYNGLISSASSTNPDKIDCVKLKVTSSN